MSAPLAAVAAAAASANAAAPTAPSPTRRPFILDMETADPDDFLTLLLLLGHPAVNLIAVTVTPGTRWQLSIVHQACEWFGRRPNVDIAIGAHNPDHKGGTVDCVSAWHYNAYPQLKNSPLPADAPVEPGWSVLLRLFKPGVTVVEGAAPKNLGAMLKKILAEQAEANPAAKPILGRLFFQGGFAGEGIVPPELQLSKFKGKVSVPSFNPGGDPQATLSIIEHRHLFEDLRFISKNVCHGVMYDARLHSFFKMSIDMRRVSTTAATTANQNDNNSNHELKSQQLIFQGMDHYLRKKADGKAFHDPLAACCAIDPRVGVWAQNVVMQLTPRGGEWYCVAVPPEQRGHMIIIDYDFVQMVKTLLPSLRDCGFAELPVPKKAQRQQEQQQQEQQQSAVGPARNEDDDAGDKSQHVPVGGQAAPAAAAASKAHRGRKNRVQ